MTMGVVESGHHEFASAVNDLTAFRIGHPLRNRKEPSIFNNNIHVLSDLEFLIQHFHVFDDHILPPLLIPRCTSYVFPGYYITSYTQT